MDLADLWGQHKKFILAVGGALLLLLVGRGFLLSNYDYENAEDDAKKLAAAMASVPDVATDVVGRVDAEVAALRTRYAELAGTMRFKVADEFTLPPNEADPRAFFFLRHHKMQQALVDVAEKQDIRMPEALGLKNSPTDPEEIRRTLVALDVIQEVLAQSIAAGVRRVESISIEDAQRGRARAASFVKDLHVDFDVVGGEKALRSLVAGVVDDAAHGKSPYLAVDKARLKPVKGEEGMLELTLSLAALTIDKSDAEEARR
jgi:hypothetical protein